MRRLTLNQALILAVFVSLLPVAAFSILQGLLAQRHNQSLIGERLTSSALATAAMQREPIALSERVLGSLARNSVIRGMADGCSELIADVISDQQILINIIRSDTSGAVRCSALPFKPGTTFSGEDWWETGKTRQGFSVSRPTIGKVSGKRVIIAVNPLFDERNRFQGMMTAAIPIRWIEQALNKTRLSADAVAALADQDGRILVASAPTTISRVDIDASFARTATLTDGQSKKWLYSSAPIYRRELHVVYAEPQSALTGFARDQLRADFVFALLSLLFASLAVWIGMHRLVIRWLRRLGDLARQFAAGDFRGDRDLFRSAPYEIADFSENLHSMSEAISRRNAELEQAAIETRAMAREVNHRVKNNLQMILSLLGLQSARLPDSAARTVVDQTRARIAALALVQRLAYDTGTRAEQGFVDMPALLNELCEQVKAEFSGRRDISLLCEAEISEEHIDRAVPLALIVLEAVANAFRHGFPEGRGGKVLVTFREERGTRVLTISDDGTGYDPALRDARRMGRDLMVGLARQMDAQLNTRASAGSGVTITVEFNAAVPRAQAEAIAPAA